MYTDSVSLNVVVVMVGYLLCLTSFKFKIFDYVTLDKMAVDEMAVDKMPCFLQICSFLESKKNQYKPVLNRFQDLFVILFNLQVRPESIRVEQLVTELLDFALS
jgi:hypothetical protein